MKALARFVGLARFFQDIGISYSRTPVIQTLKGNEKAVRVNGVDFKIQFATLKIDSHNDFSAL